MRKIELKVSDKNVTPENSPIKINIRILPENAGVDIKNIGFKAVTPSGVETNTAEITLTDGGAVLNPKGDGKYRLRAFCNNGKPFEEVISDIEMENSGFGPASFDPYSEIICASLATNASEMQSDMGGGLLLRGCRNVIFKKTDFGKIGSDEITIGIYTYNQGVIPVELLCDGKKISVLDFQAENEWNTYKYRSFTLPEKLRGEHDIELRFPEELRFKGFKFSNPRRNGVEILAIESDKVYGDSFIAGEKMLEKIGNNVSVQFSGIDFGKGANVMEITGRTRNPKDTVRLKFSDHADINVEFGGSDELITRRFEIDEIRGIQDLTAVFLPGTDFDFKSLKFMKG